jgi:hypothetical protein
MTGRSRYISLVTGLALILPLPAQADKLSLTPGQPVAVACQTRAVVVAESGAKASSGGFALTLALAKREGRGAEDAAQNAGAGTWVVRSADANHNGSFALLQREQCRDGCPLTLGRDGAAQLWWPGPKVLDQQGDQDVLVLAVLDGGTLRLKASTFRGKQIEALEEGQCRMDP